MYLYNKSTMLNNKKCAKEHLFLKDYNTTIEKSIVEEYTYLRGQYACAGALV